MYGGKIVQYILCPYADSHDRPIAIGHNAEVQNVPIDGSGTVASKGSLAIGSDAKVYGASYSLSLIHI